MYFPSIISVLATNVNVKPKVTFTFNVCFEIGHFKVIINPVHDKVWEPWIFSTSLEKLVKEFKAFLSEIISKYLEAH